MITVIFDNEKKLFFEDALTADYSGNYLIVAGRTWSKVFSLKKVIGWETDSD